MRTERMCSVAFKGRHTQDVTVPAGSSVAVPYTIVPLAVGMLPLEVMVLGRDLTGDDRDLTGTDRIEKQLRVVVSGRGARPLPQLLSSGSTARGIGADAALDLSVLPAGDLAPLSNRWRACRKLKYGAKCWTPWLKEVGGTHLCGHWRWFPLGLLPLQILNFPKIIPVSAALFLLLRPGFAVLIKRFLLGVCFRFHRGPADRLRQGRAGVRRTELLPGDVHQRPRSVTRSCEDEPTVCLWWGRLTPPPVLLLFTPLPGNVLADSIENSISDDPLARLIQMPGGCVEQNLATITLPLIAALYLERSGGWESVGVEKKADALRYIKKGQRLTAGQLLLTIIIRRKQKHSCRHLKNTQYPQID